MLQSTFLNFKLRQSLQNPFLSADFFNLNVIFKDENRRAAVLKGDRLPMGKYFYTLEYDDKGKHIQKSGYLYIITNKFQKEDC